MNTIVYVVMSREWAINRAGSRWKRRTDTAAPLDLACHVFTRTLRGRDSAVEQALLICIA